MIRSWISSQYLGHQNLKNALDCIKRSFENTALTPVLATVYPDTVSGTPGMGGILRVVQTFAYRIGDTTYLKGVGITSAINTGDCTVGLIQRTATDQTAAGDNNIAATYYRAGVLLIDSSGNFSSIAGPQTGRQDGIGAAGGARSRALANLVDQLDTDDIEDKAIVAFWVIGDGTNAFTSTSSLTISTNLDLYQCGGRALATGQSYDGNQMLGLL